MLTRVCDVWADLIDEVASGGMVDPAENDTIAARLFLWDGRTITGTHVSKPPDIKTSETCFITQRDDEAVQQLIKRLLDQELPFVTQFGEGETLRTLEWTIEDA